MNRQDWSRTSLKAETETETGFGNCQNKAGTTRVVHT